MASDGSLHFDTSIDGSGFQKAIGAMGSLTVKALAATTAALVAGGIAVIKYGSEFETGMAKVSTLVDATSTQGAAALDALNTSLLDTSSATGQTAASLTEAAYQALSAGVAIEAAGGFVETAANLAIGGFTSTEAAVDVLTSVMNAYGEGMYNAAQLSDMLIMTQNKGKTTVDELSHSLSQVTPTAAAMGVEFEQVAAALATMTAQGTPTAQATTQLNQLFTDLGKEGLTAAKILREQTGYSFQELMNKGASLGDVISLLRVGLSDNASAVADMMTSYNDATGELFTFEDACTALNLSAGDLDGELINMFGSVEAGKAALQLASQDGAAFKSNLDAITDSSGAVDTAVSKMMDTFDAKSKQFIATAQNMAIEIYQGVEDPLKQAADAGLGYLNQLSDAFDMGGLSGLISAFGLVVADLATAMIDAAPMVIDAGVSMISAFLDGLIGALPQIAQAGAQIAVSLMDGLGQLLPKIAQGAIQLVAQLALALGAAAPAILCTIATLVATLAQTLLDGLPALAQSAFVLMQGLAEGFLIAIPVLIATIPKLIESYVAYFATCISLLSTTGTDIIVGLIDGIVAAIPTLTAMVPQIITSILTALIAALPQLLTAATQIMLALINGLRTAIPALLQMIPEIIVAITTTLLQHLPEILMCAVQIVVALVQGILSAIPMLIDIIISINTTMIQTMLASLSAFVTVGTQWLQGLWQGVQSWVGSFLSNTIGFTKSAISSIDNGFSNIASIGLNIVQGLWNGIKGATSWLMSQISGWVSGIVGGIKGFFGIHSPSKLIADEVGRFLPPGVVVGVKAAMPKAQSDMRNLMGELVSSARAAVSQANFSIGTNITGTSRLTELTGLQAAPATSAAPPPACLTFRQTNISPEPINGASASRNAEDMLNFHKTDWRIG